MFMLLYVYSYHDSLFESLSSPSLCSLLPSFTSPLRQAYWTVSRAHDSQSGIVSARAAVRIRETFTFIISYSDYYSTFILSLFISSWYLRLSGAVR